MLLAVKTSAPVAPTRKDLYEEDFFVWTVQTAERLRAGRLADADLEHIAEEIEDMGKRDRHELRSHLRVLLSHLLKWKFQVSRRSRSWRAAIDVQRDELMHQLRPMPSLRGYLQDQLTEVYPAAVKGAIAETDLPDEAFPPACPFSLDQILDADFFPD